MASYWKPPTDFYGDPVYGGTLRINYEDPLEHANAWGARTGAAMRYRVPTHDNLIQDNPYDPSAPFIPGLAYGWTVDDDLKGVTFFLKDNVQWQNGEPFTCEDARFSYETMITGEGLTGSYMKNRLSDVDLNALECVDDYTLKFRFMVPSAVPLLNFGKIESMIFNKAWFQAGGENVMFQDAAIGTGPFIWAEGQLVGVDEQHFDRNPNYHVDGLPYVDEVVVFGILDESAQQAAMLAHQTDWHWVRNFGQYDQYVKHDQIPNGNSGHPQQREPVDQHPKCAVGQRPDQAGHSHGVRQGNRNQGNFVRLWFSRPGPDASRQPLGVVRGARLQRSRLVPTRRY